MNANPAIQDDNVLRVLELYSGIGGMHFAFNAALERLEMEGNYPRPKVKIRAVDINSAAALVYTHNFPETPAQTRDIRALGSDAFEGLWMLTMSPPCQPFSRNGKFRDVEDDRCQSFLFVLDQLSRVQKPPSMLVMENVKGFELSTAHAKFLEILKLRNYQFTEYLLNPLDYGFPNSRLRYYLTATHSGKNIDLTDEISPSSEEGFAANARKLDVFRESRSCTLEKYFALRFSGDDLECDKCSPVPIPTLRQYVTVMDIKHPESTSTNCFIRNYGRYIKGSGSIFCPLPKEKFDVLMRDFIDSSSEEHKIQVLSEMKMRFFTPMEIACLMGFPRDFDVPKHLPDRQAWKLLGNSLNVHIVSLLMYTLLINRP